MWGFGRHREVARSARVARRHNATVDFRLQGACALHELLFCSCAIKTPIQTLIPCCSGPGQGWRPTDISKEVLQTSLSTRTQDDES
ncbi:hypothetical protein VFPPC_15880 [Pochonia chlamydosporia 170]|uniref:Uncharacterized protein n=1 Tax=Pochonia chlamydosporia 170 TaxID=1380566 RepID=A0A179FTX7_METCM|nr:hypothetical protein VFPPC_15880 [Pochonia chlamydosporia 170]OAQ68807.1 hypothetical protein VFPPC_15880 [Pochonia chlamydosporia 170]